MTRDDVYVKVHFGYLFNIDLLCESSLPKLVPHFCKTSRNVDGLGCRFGFMCKYFSTEYTLKGFERISDANTVVLNIYKFFVCRELIATCLWIGLLDGLYFLW